MAEIFTLTWADPALPDALEWQVRLDKILPGAARMAGWTQTQTLQFRTMPAPAPLAERIGRLLEARPSHACLISAKVFADEAFFGELCQLCSALAAHHAVLLRSDGAALALLFQGRIGISDLDPLPEGSTWLGVAATAFHGKEVVRLRQNDIQAILGAAP